MNRIDRYWSQYLTSTPEGSPRPDRFAEAFFFGTDPSRAHEITRLVLNGTKTATGALLWAIEADGRRPARAGDHSIVTNGSDDPRCIIETVDARIIPFEEVGSEYARWGGEGDRTLAGWREMYWSYIESECRRIGRAADRRAPLVMERFRVVYGQPLRDPEANSGI